MAKFAAAEAGVRCVDQAIQAHGGNGLAREYGLADLYWGVRLLRIAPVSREMILNYVAEHSLRAAKVLLMRRADQPDRPISLFDVVKRAVDIVDPDDDDPDMGDLEEIFEDADEPVTGVENLEERVALAVEGIDNAVENPAVSVAAAVILYLAYRRDELNADPDHVLRLTARAEWKGDPPQNVRDWLQARGITV